MASHGWVIQRVFKDQDVEQGHWAVGFYDDTDDFVMVGEPYERLFEAEAKVNFLNGGMKLEELTDIRRSLWNLANTMEKIRESLDKARIHHL